MGQKKDCVNREENRKNCTCDSTACSRRGVCCECVAYHRANGELPMCLR